MSSVLLTNFENCLTLVKLSSIIQGMSGLNINQLQQILDLSYPTALKFAQENGERDDSGYGRWFVPVEVVADILNKEQANLNRRRTMLEGLVNGSG